jgi:hypothetical protein
MTPVYAARAASPVRAVGAPPFETSVLTAVAASTTTAYKPVVVYYDN